MATVAAITELHRPRRYAMDYKLKRTATRAFLVRFDDPVREGLEAAISVGINFGDIYRTQNAATDGTYTYDSGLIATDFEAEPHDEDHYQIWKVTWNYRSELDDPTLHSAYAQGGTGIGGGSTSGGGGLNEEPWLEPQKIFFGKNQRKTALHKSLDNPPKRFVNSAGTPFSTVPETDDGLLTMTIVRNEQFINVTETMDAYSAYWDTVNDDPFFSWMPGLVKCDSITAQSDYRNKQRFYVVTYQFTIGKDISSHWWRAVDKGPKYFINANELVQAVERAGHPNEVFLDGSGALLPDGDDPEKIDFVIYESKSFAPLGLDADG